MREGILHQSIKQAIRDFLEKQSEESASYIIAVLAIAASFIAKLAGFTGREIAC